MPTGPTRVDRREFIKTGTLAAGAVAFGVPRLVRAQNLNSKLNIGCVGFMGGASGLGLGLALAQPERKVLVLDGDGALLLNLSSLPTLGWQRPPNLIHCVFVNGVYEASGGGRNANSANADLVAIAKGAGVPHAVWVDSVEDFRREVAAAFARNELSFVAARVEPGVQPGLKGIDVQAVENKFLLARHIERTEGIQVLAPAYPQR